MEEHKRILYDMLGDTSYINILDLGSGRTSMSILLEKFPKSNIIGICYPGDNRKLDKIRQECKGNYELIEKDICKEPHDESYDLILCHLLFGEATKFDNSVDDMANKVFSLQGAHILVVDYLEDKDISFIKLIDIAEEKGYRVIKKEIYKKEFEENYSTFIGKNYIAILFERV